VVTVRVPGVNKVTVRKGGRRYVYYYHRATGTPIRDPAGRRLTPQDAGFAGAVEAIEAAMPRPVPSGAGTLGALIAAYRASPEFAALADRTRADYGRVLDWLDGGGGMPLADLDGAFILALRDRAYAQHRRRFANYVVQMLSILCGWGHLRTEFRAWLRVNPAAGVPLIARPKRQGEANRPWDDAEAEAMLAAATGGLRRAIALGRYTGLRIGDAVACMRNRYRDGRFQVLTAKTGEPLWIPAHPRLVAILADGVAASTHFVTRADGQPYTLSGLQSQFERLRKRLEKEGKVAPGLTFHGLRHTLGGILADLGATPQTIAACLGQRTTRMAEHYSRRANRKKLVQLAAKRLERKLT